MSRIRPTNLRNRLSRVNTEEKHESVQYRFRKYLYMKKLLLVGSSIFADWHNLKQLASHFTISNRAVGGTMTAYWQEHLAAVVTEEAPDVVLFYCGSNDLNDAVPAEVIRAQTLQCCAIVHQCASNAALAYFSIMKAPQKQGKWELIDALNESIRRALPDGDLYIETNAVVFGDEQPVDTFFVEDGLHLTSDAYAALDAYAAPRIVAWLEAGTPHADT